MEIQVLASFVVLGIYTTFTVAENPYQQYQQLESEQQQQQQYQQFEPEQKQYQQFQQSQYHQFEQIEPKKPYSFSYGIRDSYNGADFGQEEESDGNRVLGSYTVQLPDGRKQTVTYEADHNNGFVAHVTYEGMAQYPSKVGPPFIVRPYQGSGGGGAGAGAGMGMYQ